METKLLVEKLTQATNAYYNGEPIMTDAEYDELLEMLVKQDPEHEFLGQVGAKPEPEGPWPKKKHRAFMGSLNKVNEEADFLKWATEEEDMTLFCVSEKYDGSTVVATYDKGKFVSLVTRGDGYEGEDVTGNAKKLGVPETIEGFSGELRGEAILKLSVFKEHFDGYKNPRNTANGKVRDQKDTGLTEHVDVFWFDVLPTDRDFKTELEKWNFLRSNDLIEDRWPLFLDTNFVWKAYNEYVNGRRAELDYEIDGLVVKLNDLEQQEARGVTSGRPKGALAIKFPSEAKATTLKAIEWSRGLTGRIGPIGILEPINIGGVTVSRASLCNMDEINRLGVAVHDTVLVSRRNDVIPKIEKVLVEADNREKISPPDTCSLCEEELVKDGVWWICQNLDCQGQTFGDLMNWLKTLKIKGIGPSVLRSLIEEGVMNPYDLHTAEEATYIRAAGDKTGKKLHVAVSAVKEVTLHQFLTGFNIRSLGNTNGKRLEKEFKELDKVLAAGVEDFKKIAGIKTNAGHIYHGLQAKKNMIDKLSSLLKVKSLDMSGPLAGKSICITGELSKPRPEIADWVKEHGGDVKSGVSKDLTYLVTNDPNSGTSKNKKADKYGIKKLTEQELYDLV